MRIEFPRFRSPVSTVSALLLFTALAGCSSDARRVEMPWSVPVASNTHADQSDYTGSISKPAATSSSWAQVKSQSLPPLGASPSQPAQSTVASQDYKPSAPVYAPYAGKAEPTFEQPRQAVAAHAGSGEVVVEKGDTLYSIATRNNVPVGSLMVANNLTSASSVKVGQRLVVPGAQHAVASQRNESAIAPKPFADSASALPEAATRQAIKIDQNRKQPAVMARAETPAVAQPEASAKEKAVRVIPMTKDAAEKVAVAPKAEPVEVAKAEPAETKIEKVDTTASLPNPAAMTSTEFRWPVQGRVVENFGAQQGGGRNDGINIAVPAGTPVKAAENGVVAYAGSELKGYGKLVLIRHDNDYVTAYAHNSDISVKRGDKVVRGQVIGKAGQTGNVSQPQVHFEIRKGSSPIDPMGHLSGT